LLKAHGAIISGSVALKYFLPGAQWEPNDLDIYVPERTFEAFVTYRFTPGDELHAVPLIDVNSTPPMEPEASDLPSSHSGIREVRKFYTPSDKRVDIITGPGDNPILAVNQFWTSLVQNFLRSDVAVCGFPRFTLNNVGLLKT
ncbi:hypothetical protein C8T65DRAFT_532769, partial [Cerioporus squamosus]